MLTFMRRHAKSWLIKVLLGTVIVVFIFFYGFNLRQRSANLVASVNGVKIGIQQFKSQYERLLQYQPERASLTPEQLRALKEAALEHLIDQVLLLEQAERWKLSVSDTEVTTQIHQIPAFQEDGQFVYARFQQILRFQGLTEKDFLEDMRRSLLIQKTQDLIRDSAKATDEDVASLYRLFNERLILQYISLGPEQFEAQATVSEDEMPDFFKKHIDDYRVPEKVRVRYLRFDPKTYLSDIEVSDQEIQERYEATKERWRVSRQALARHILLRTTEEEDPKARMTVFQKAEAILKRAQAGEDFVKLAKDYSEEPETAAQGGLMGWKRPGELPEALDKALFQELTPGQLSDRPIKSPAGFHILKLDEIRSERMRELDEVKAQLVTEIRNEKASQSASDHADKAYLAIFQGAPFEEASEEFGVPLIQTPYFSMNDASDEIPGALAFREAAFELKEQGDFSEVTEDGGLYFVIELMERQPSRAPELEEVLDRVREDLKRDKARELARAEAEEIIQRIQKKEQTLEEIAKERNRPLAVSPTLGRLFQTGGLPPDLVKAAFSLHGDQTLVEKPYSSGDQVLVAEVKERIPPDPAGLKEQAGLYRSILLREKREGSYRNWLEMLRANSEIKTYKTFQELL